jgi:hypothetical protein
MTNELIGEVAVPDVWQYRDETQRVLNLLDENGLSSGTLEVSLLFTLNDGESHAEVFISFYY